MKKNKIIVHCLVQNESRFVWYAINSVLPHVDKLMVWDMGSIDGSDKIIKGIASEKVIFRQVHAATSPNDLTKVRQQMIEATPREYTWIMILDGDEIWSEKAIKEVTEFARSNPDYESVVVRTNNLVGDIYHRLPESAGRYQLAGRQGHLNLRLMNFKVIPGLNVQKPHGQQGYFDNKGNLVQNRNTQKIKFVNVFYHHATHLQRSLQRAGDLSVPKRKQKLKYEFGEPIPVNQIPEVFFAPRPPLVPDVTAPAPLSFWFLAVLLTLPRRLKRLILPPKAGY